MNVTKKHAYGLAAMTHLAIYGAESPVQLRLISEAASIPHSFLEQFILNLKKSGLVKSTRGVRGGYQLAKSPDLITVSDIFSAIDPLLFDVSADGLLSFFWADFNNHIAHFLNVPLSRLLNDIKKREKVLTYSI